MWNYEYGLNSKLLRSRSVLLLVWWACDGHRFSRDPRENFKWYFDQLHQYEGNKAINFFDNEGVVSALAEKQFRHKWVGRQPKV